MASESIAPSGKIHEWTATAFLFQAGYNIARIFRSTETVELAGIDRRFLALFKEDALYASIYGTGPTFPFLFGGETVEKAVAIFMPIRLDPLPREPAIVGKVAEKAEEDKGVIASALRRKKK